VSSAPYRCRARIRLQLPASAAAERIPSTVAHPQADGDAACILHTGAESPDVLPAYAAILGAEFEILDPPELAAHVAAWPAGSPARPATWRLSPHRRAARTPRPGTPRATR
jgi:hypothetical protein